MIIANHPELNISVKTLYNYIDQGLLLARNVDLKRKVKFKPRKCHKTQITDREVFNGRTFQDFTLHPLHCMIRFPFFSQIHLTEAVYQNSSPEHTYRNFL